MSTRATGHIVNKGWNEQPYHEMESGRKLSRASVVNDFHGDIEGKGTLEYLLNYDTPTTGSYLGYERVVGSLGTRTGSFVLEHRGTWDGPTVHGSWSVVPGSGTGELAGLSGTGGFVARHGDKETPYTLDYSIG
ncbi:MAG TPA: DUF3224 domain-containing protein [Gemmatimonadaceae bacterium]